MEVIQQALLAPYNIFTYNFNLFGYDMSLLSIFLYIFIAGILCSILKSIFDL